MKEFIEKLIGRLEEEKQQKPCRNITQCKNCKYTNMCLEGEQSNKVAIDNAIEIAKELAEEYKDSFMEELLEAKRNCSEDSDCSECPFGQIEDRCILAELQVTGGNNGWIPVSERLPEEKEHEMVLYTDYANEVDMCFTDEFLYRRKAMLAWQPLPESYKTRK